MSPLLLSHARSEAEKKWLMMGDKISSFAAASNTVPAMEPCGKEEKGLQSSWVPRVAEGCPRLLCGSA